MAWQGGEFHNGGTKLQEQFHRCGETKLQEKEDHSQMISTINVGIEGITPLIVNRFHEEAQEAASSGEHSRKERPSPQDDAANRLYQNGNGIFYPAENIRQSLIGAASRHKIGRRAATADMAASIFVTPFELPLEGEWHVDSRPVVIQRARIVRHRPMFDEWLIRFQIQIDTDLVSERLVRLVLEDAGKLVGIGDFRPAKKGQYGRFSVSSWEKQV